MVKRHRRSSMRAEGPRTRGAAAPQAGASRLADLPLALLLHVAEHLPPNEVPCSLRLVCKDLAQRLCDPAHRTVRLGLPLPPHADEWWQCWEGGLRRLSFASRLLLLSTAAASGCATNLVVARQLVQPGLAAPIPEVLQECKGAMAGNPAVTAARLGHGHLLPWLLAHEWLLVRDIRTVMVDVAEHCNLAAVKWLCRKAEEAEAEEDASEDTGGCGHDSDGSDDSHDGEGGGGGGGSGGGEGEDDDDDDEDGSGGEDDDDESFSQHLSSDSDDGQDEMFWFTSSRGRGLAAAARSRRPDAREKLEWLLRTTPHGTHHKALEGAAVAGDVPLLQWLWDRRVRVAGSDLSHLLWAALRSATASTEAVQWLLRRGAGDVFGWGGGFADEVSYDKLEWMAAQPDREVAAEQWDDACRDAAAAGDLAAVARLHGARGAALTEEVWADAAWSGNVELLGWLLSKGCPRDEDAFSAAAARGNAEVLVWLLRRAPCSLHACPIAVAIEGWPYPYETRRWESRTAHAPTGVGAGVDGPGLLRAVQELLGAGAGVRGCAPAPSQHRSAFNAAAARGYLPLLQLVHAQGGTWDKGSMAAAAEGGCEEVLEWLVAQGAHRRAGGGSGSRSVHGEAVRNRDASTLRALTRLGVPRR